MPKVVRKNVARKALSSSLHSRTSEAKQEKQTASAESLFRAPLNEKPSKPTTPRKDSIKKSDIVENSGISGKEGLSRGQRKRLAKREQYLKKEKMILSSLKLKREEEQKKRIDGLDAIKEALLETVRTDQTKPTSDNETDDAKTKKPSMLKSNRSRQELLTKEATQMNLVLQHPSFQVDPLATIREHLKNTLAKDAEQNKKQVTIHLKERKAEEEKKKAFKKENGIKKRRKKRVKATRSKSR